MARGYGNEIDEGCGQGLEETLNAFLNLHQ